MKIAVIQSANSEGRERMKFKEKLGKEMLICDGAMGTLLIENGLKAGELPEMWNIEHPDIFIKFTSSM
mgnify:FL=1